VLKKDVALLPIRCQRRPAHEPGHDDRALCYVLPET
jgi:hypothetical protein